MAETGWLHDRLAISPIGIHLDSPFPLRFSGSIIFDSSSISTSQRCPLRLSSTTFRGPPTLWITRFCLPIVRVLSSALLPAYHRPRVLSTTRESATLSRLAALGSPLRFGLDQARWHLAIDPEVRASPGKVTLPHRMPSSFTSVWLTFQISELAHSRLLVPPLQGHIAGLLFATYTVSTSCFLRTLGWPRKPLPCWCCPSV